MSAKPNIPIIYEDNHLLVIEKPVNILSQEDRDGYPLIGDQKYGNKGQEMGQQIALFASQISFIHPTTQRKLKFSVRQPAGYPWELFADVLL